MTQDRPVLGIILMLGTMAILITKGTELWIVPLAAQDLVIIPVPDLHVSRIGRVDCG